MIDFKAELANLEPLEIDYDEDLNVSEIKDIIDIILSLTKNEN